MAYFVDPDGAIVEASESFADEGYRPATQEDIAAHNAPLLKEDRSGGTLNEVITGAEEAVRKGASLTAATVRGTASAIQGATGFGTAPGLVAESPSVKGKDLVPGAFSDQALERREVNPTAAAIGGQGPLIVADQALRLAGPLGIPGMLALDLVDGVAQAAMDAELQGRGIKGSDILYNAGLNTLFSGAGYAIPAAAKSVIRGSGNVVHRAAESATGFLERQSIKSAVKRADTLVEQADTAVSKVKPPKVQNNWKAQVGAIEGLAERFEKSDPKVLSTLESLKKGSVRDRFNGLQELQETLPLDSEVRTAVDEILAKPELWGEKFLLHNADVEAARSLKPVSGAGTDSWSAYTDALRKLKQPKLDKLAEQLDEIGNETFTERLMRTGLVEKVSNVVTDKVVGKGLKLGLGALGLAKGPVGAAAGYATGEAFGPALASYLKPHVKTGLVEAASALKGLAEADLRTTARLLVNPEAASRYMRLYGDAMTPMSRFQGDHGTPQQAFQQHRSALQEFSRNPAKMADLLAEELGDIQEVSPALYRDMAQQGMRISNYLQAEMPKPRGISVARPNGTPPSLLEIRQYALKFSAATDPASVMADARAGRLRREQVQTLKALWPAEYESLRNAVLEQLGQGSSTTVRQRMNLLFGFGSSVDPALGPRVTKAIAQSRAQAEKNKTGRTGGMTRSTPPSVYGAQPGGLAALDLGTQIGAGR